MKEISMLHPMQPSKETDNKLRWEAWDQDFKLYIPKWRVPQPWPIRIVVRLDDDPRSFGSVPAPRGPESAQARNLNEPLTALLLKVKEHTQTVHYKPVGQPKMWEIGEPYIPSRSSMNSLRRTEFGLRCLGILLQARGTRSSSSSLKATVT